MELHKEGEILLAVSKSPKSFINDLECSRRVNLPRKVNFRDYSDLGFLVLVESRDSHNGTVFCADKLLKLNKITEELYD